VSLFFLLFFSSFSRRVVHSYMRSGKKNDCVGSFTRPLTLAQAERNENSKIEWLEVVFWLLPFSRSLTPKIYDRLHFSGTSTGPLFVYRFLWRTKLFREGLLVELARRNECEGYRCTNVSLILSLFAGPSKHFRNFSTSTPTSRGRMKCTSAWGLCSK
jgi:hypothetical protein